MGCISSNLFRSSQSVNSRISTEAKINDNSAPTNQQRPAINQSCQDMRSPVLSENLKNTYYERQHIEAKFINAIEKDDAVKLKAMLDKKEVSNHDNLGDNIFTAVHRAVRHSPRTLQLLIDYGYDVNTESKDDRLTTPLHLAVMSNNITTLKILLESGKTNINSVNSVGLTSLHITSFDKFNQGAELLLKHGANPNIDMPPGTSMLTASIAAYNSELAKLLVKYGGDVNHNQQQLTPLVTACAKENVELVSLLLDNGADPNAPEGTKAPLQIARMLQNQVIIDLLKNGISDA